MPRKIEIKTNPVGMHVSISGHIHLAIDRAVELGCRGTFQVFTCSPQKWNANQIPDSEAELFIEKTTANKFVPFCHMPYLPNLSSPNKDTYVQSVKVLIREVNRCRQLGIKHLVLHVGSHLGTTVLDGQQRLIDACIDCIQETRKMDVRLLLENSAGIKNSVGSTFEYIRSMLDKINNDGRTGVCFDTCHAFASGYDLSNEKEVAKTLEQFDKAIGFEKLKLIHLNDSVGALGGARDRHENIGQGKIGYEGFRGLLDQIPLDIPLVLETPIHKVGDDKRNLDRVKLILDNRDKRSRSSR